MNGYVIAPEGTDAQAVFDEPGVRHVATLATGELLVAFEGERPCAGSLLLNADEPMPWWDLVRHRTPHGGEGFYLFTVEGFDELKTGMIAAASLLHTGNVLVQTDGRELDGALWGSKALHYLDARLPAPALV